MRCVYLRDDYSHERRRRHRDSNVSQVIIYATMKSNSQLRVLLGKRNRFLVVVVVVVVLGSNLTCRVERDQVCGGSDPSN